MLIIFLFGLFFLPISYLYGLGTLWLINILFHLPLSETPKPILIHLTGLMALGTLGTILSLFFPLQGLTFGIILAGAGTIYIWGKIQRVEIFTMPFHGRKLPFLIGLLGGILVLTVLMSATRQPSNPDTGLYHAQAIRWIESYRAVPGLGNFHHRFAYNSSWLVLNALFSLTFLGGQSFHLIPAMLVLLVLFELLSGLAAWWNGQLHVSNILRTLLIPIFFYTQASEISSPGTDLPGTLFLWMIIVFGLEEIGNKPQKLTRAGIVLFALSVFTITIKLSFFPVLLMAAILGWSGRGDPKSILKLLGIALVILIPWLARNVLLSGYLVYPLAGIDVFHFDWKIPAEFVLGDQRSIMAWARIPHEDVDQVLALPVQIWTQIWFDNLTSNRKLIVLFGGISPFVMLAQYRWSKIRRKITFQVPSSLFIAFLIILLGGIYWFFTAPDFRFGYGFLMLLLLFPFLLPVWGASEVLPQFRLFPALLTVLLILYQVRFVTQISENFSPPQLLTSLPYPTLPTEPCELQNRTIFCPAPISYKSCWYEPFPCAPSARPKVALRGLDFQEGFRYVP